MKENEASSTAFTVVQGILYAAQQPQYKHLVPEDMANATQQILMSSEREQNKLKLLKKTWFCLFISAIERFFIPGIKLHFVLRKRFYEFFLINQRATKN